MKTRIFGEIKGIKEGEIFSNRINLSHSKVHKPIQAGISGSQKEGADSIVLSGGYEDDEDYENVIIYTGHGGRDLNSGKQVTDQELIKQNLALALNCQKGLLVRVIRGAKHVSEFSPTEGYRYDGLFRVMEYWREKGRSGFYVWRFRLEKMSKESNDNYVLQEEISLFNDDGNNYKKTKKLKTTIQRIVRDTDLSRSVKELYKYKCQICGTAIETNSGLYAEAAHIKPLGAPHNGPDTLSNIICLCPNHHVKFDYGGLTILDNFELLGEEGSLYVHPKHKLDINFFKYHKEHFYIDK